MLGRLVARFPFLPDAVTVLAFVLGLVWRYLHVFVLHDPRGYVYSEMLLYADQARTIADPAHALGPRDVTMSPGLTELLAWSYRGDPSMQSALWLQLTASVLLPPAIGLLGYVVFDKTAARAAVVLASLYYPFVDLAGYFLPEGFVALFGTLGLASYFGAIRALERLPEGRRRLLVAGAAAAAAGALFSLAAAMRFYAVAVLASLLLVHFVLSRGAPRKLRAIAIAATLVGAAPLLGWQASRCTAANGNFCPSTNTIPAEVLLGHYGRIQGIVWRDPKTGDAWARGSSAYYQHGFRERPEVSFRITEQRKNFALARKWTKRHTWHSFVLSLQHVWDTFGGTIAWPSMATGYWPVIQGFQYGFLAFLFFPVLAHLVDVALRRGVAGLLRSTELAVMAPIFGVALWAFFTSAEQRLRIPWDGVFILLAVQFYRALKIPLRDPTAAAAAAPPPEAAEPEPAEAKEAA